MSVPKIQTKAKAFGTFSSKSEGIIYIDPNHEDERHHSPVLSPADAKEAFTRGLIEDPDGAKEVDEAEPQEVRDPNSLANVAVERTAVHAEADAAVSPQPSSLDSRQSTAWSDPERVGGPAHGYTDGVRPSGDEFDADEAPAPARRRPGPKPKSAA